MKKSWKYGAMRTKFKKFVGYLSNIKQFIRSDSRKTWKQLNVSCFGINIRSFAIINL